MIDRTKTRRREETTLHPPQLNSTPPQDEEGSASLCAAVVRAWTNFAASGDPNTAPPHKPPGPLAPTAVLPPWPALTPADPDRCMVLDVPLAASHTQAVRIHEHFPVLWAVAKENARALWFHRAPKGGTAGEMAAKERVLQSNL